MFKRKKKFIYNNLIKSQDNTFYKGMRILFVVMIICAFTSGSVAGFWEGGHITEKLIGNLWTSDSRLDVNSSGTVDSWLDINMLQGPTPVLTSNYKYYIKYDVENTCAVATTDRIELPINALSLVSGGYIASDARDILLISGATEEDALALDLANNATNWYSDIDTIPAETVVSKYLWLGNQYILDRDQDWVSVYGDSNYAADDASLDITTDLTLSTDVYLHDLPVAEREIISKEGSYELVVDATDFIFRVWQAGAGGAEDLSPNGVGDSSGLNRIVGAANWENVDDAPPLGAGADGTNVYINNATGTDYYSIDTSGIIEGSSITSITVYYRVSKDVGTNGTATPLLRLNSVNTIGTPVNFAPAAWSNHNEVLAKPGGGDWSLDDLNNLQVGIILNSTDSNATRCSQMYAHINYVLPDAGHESSITATTDTWVTLECEYDGANMSITDGTLSDSDALVGALHTNAEPLHIAEFTGKIDSTVIQDTAVDVLNLEYEPDEISDTTITDLSVLPAVGNNITYSLTPMDACISVSSGIMIPIITGDVITSASLISDAAGIFNPNGSTSTEESMSGEDVGNIPDQIIDPLADISGVDRQMIWWYGYGLIVILIFTAIFKTTNGNIFWGWVSAIVVTGLFVSYGPIPWYFISFYVMGAIGTLTIERSPQVG